MNQVTYESVLQLILEGASDEFVEEILTDEHTPLTDKQIADLRAELAAVKS